MTSELGSDRHVRYDKYFNSLANDEPSPEIRVRPNRAHGLWIVEQVRNPKSARLYHASQILFRRHRVCNSLGISAKQSVVHLRSIRRRALDAIDNEVFHRRRHQLQFQSELFL